MGNQLAGPLRDRGITVTMDLHKTQRVVRPGPEAGTVWVDGSLYSSALPETHRTLKAPTAGMSAAEKARRREAFDACEPYRFAPHAKRDTTRGNQRFRGPAVDLAVTLIGHNLASLHAWHTRRGRPEPWQVHLGEPLDDRPLDKATRTRGRRRRPTD